MYRDVIQDSLDYIEDNIKCEISARELSERAGFSLFHYYRLFQMTVGMRAFIKHLSVSLDVHLHST